LIVEINFDGIVGPGHNHAGLSPGNVASQAHHGETSYPREAALQGTAKMRHTMSLGLAQGFLLPHPRPANAWLAELGTSAGEAPDHLRAAAFSASAMWAANAATVSPAADTGDGRCHLSVANLRTMPHRSHEAGYTERQLRIAFSDARHFAVHAAVPGTYGDEGAANHMRLAPAHDAPGVEIFVHGRSGGGLPVRQHEEAGRAIARRHGLDPARTLFFTQSEAAIAAGAFHNDVVAVANRQVLFVHQQAFEDQAACLDTLRACVADVEVIEVPAAEISLEDAVASYLFNAQLVDQPGGAMALILPAEARDRPGVWRWLNRLVEGNGPIRRLETVDLRGSMANGGGPACLRLRVVADPATVDSRFIANEATLVAIEKVIAWHWPEKIAPADLSDSALVAKIEAAHAALLAVLELPELS